MRIRARHLPIFVFILILAAPAWAGITKIPVSELRPGLELLEQTDDALTFRVTVGELAAVDVETKEGSFSKLTLPGFHASREIGRPELPMINRLLEIPPGADVSVEVVDFETRILALADFGITRQLVPAQPSVSKSRDPRELPFHFDRDLYDIDRDYGPDPATLVDTGVLRSVRIGRLEIAPVSYNPVQGTITVRESIRLRVRFKGTVRSRESYRKASTYSPFFEPVYRILAGYKGSQGLHDSYPDLVNGPVTYLIVSDPMFETTLQPFVEWKTEQGFKVVEAYTDDPQVGSSTTSIQSYLHDLYNSGTPENPSPTFVLFVGDTGEIPPFSLSGVSDLPYCDVTGDDMPEMYYGRFSANSVAELEPQISKTLEYEKYELPDPSYLGASVLIAGVDGTFGPTHGNGQINYGSTHYFNSGHDILSQNYFHPASGTQDAAIVSDVDGGCSVVNYTAHASTEGWSDPTFTKSDLSGLSQSHRYCLAIGNCCLTSSFQERSCFGEYWLRVVNKGGIGYIGASSETYWDEDYYWSVGNQSIVPTGAAYDPDHLGVYDGMFHDHGEGVDQWYVVQGAHVLCGNLAVQESGSLRTSYYWEVYNLMGDPSLSAYLGVPDSNLIILPDTIFTTDTTIVVTGEPGSYVGITQGGALVGSGLVDTTGTTEIPISGQTGKGEVLVVVTCQNKIPYRESVQVAEFHQICLRAAPDSLGFGTVAQGYHPTESTSLWNDCAEEQTWSVTDKPAWVQVDPDTGTLGASPDVRPILVTIDTDLLQSGFSYSDTIRFASQADSCIVSLAIDVGPPESVSPPVVNFPKDSVVVATLTPTLIVENAIRSGGIDTVWYYFDVDTSKTFSSPGAQTSPPVEEGSSQSQWQTSDLTENALWFWRCWCTDGGSYADTSEIAAFYVNAENECPESFALVSPTADSTLVDRQPGFSWQPSVDVDPFEVATYWVFVGMGGVWDSSFADTACWIQWPLLLSDNQTYSWKVRAQDALGCNLWSEERSFAINLANDAPGSFCLVAPDSGEISSDLRPIFQWCEAVDPDPGDSVSYWVWWSADSLFQDATTDSAWVSDGISLAPSYDLEDNSIYFWRVAARDREDTRTVSSVGRFAANTEPPSFTFGILQNPFLENYVDLYAVASESLLADPTVGVTWDDFTAIVTLSRLVTSPAVYHADFEIPSGACAEAHLMGCDVGYVCGGDSSGFCGLAVGAGASAMIASHDQRARLDLPAGSLTRDTFITVVPRGPKPPVAKLEGYEDFTNELAWNPDPGRRWAMSPAFSFGPSGVSLDVEATLSFQYSAENLEGEPDWKLGMYRLDGGEWKRVASSGPAGPSEVTAQIRRLGVYQLQLDPDRQWIVPTRFRLSQNYPNPFNPSTTIEYDVPEEAVVSLRVYGVAGRLVKELVGGVRPAGRHAAMWDGTDESGARVASGVYFCRMSGPGFSETRRLVLLK